MVRLMAIVSLLGLAGCTDHSNGAALNECRLKYYLETPAAQGELIPDCMSAKSFHTVAPCSAVADEDEWDWTVTAFSYNNPRCYRPLGSKTWIATALSPI
jgi:hypothetical protein